MSRVAADYMAKALEQAGVKRVYGVVGDSLNLKAVLDGRARELIDLAKVNLTR